MALRLHCKRAKLFISQDGDRTRKVMCPPGRVTAVPDWVKDQLGYKQGIKDGSIIDITAPKAPKAVPVPETPVAVPDKPVNYDSTADEGKTDEQLEAESVAAAKEAQRLQELAPTVVDTTEDDSEGKTDEQLEQESVQRATGGRKAAGGGTVRRR